MSARCKAVFIMATYAFSEGKLKLPLKPEFARVGVAIVAQTRAKLDGVRARRHCCQVLQLQVVCVIVGFLTAGTAARERSRPPRRLAPY
jgi:hypothetical protein